MGVVGGYFYSVIILNIHKHHYWYNSEQFVGSWDFFGGVFKSLFFGAAIALVSCFQGFNCGSGAEGVGRATTRWVVQAIAIHILSPVNQSVLSIPRPRWSTANISAASRRLTWAAANRLEP